MHRLDDLVRTFEEHPEPHVQHGLIEALRAVDVLHRGALLTLRALLDERGLTDEAFADAHIALLFDLYTEQDDDEQDEQSRAEAVVASVRPYVEARGGRLEVVAADDGVVTIRLLGACSSCSGSSATLQAYVEDALRAGLPEFVRMDVANTPLQAASPPQSPAPVLIPLSALRRSAGGAELPGGCGGGGCRSSGRGCSA